jgi:hypothetical protein
MQRSVALRERGQLAVLLNRILHQARQSEEWHEPDQRNLRTWRQLVLGILVARTTRLLGLAQALLPQRQAATVKTLAIGLSSFLTKSKCPLETLTPALLEATLREVDPADMTRFRGKALLVLDPTEYPKRSRGTGKRKRHMQHIGRVRNAKGKASGTTTGYVDVWAGLVLKGKRFLPLARQLFSSQHPDLLSQNQVEETVLAAADMIAQRVGLETIVVADRGLGRKALLIKLAKEQHSFVIRLDPDITAYHRTAPDGLELAQLLAQQAWLGEVTWDRGSRGKLRCRARAVRAEIHYSCSGRKADTTAAVMTFVELVPDHPKLDPLVLATTLPVGGRFDVQGIAHVYAQRWSIESAFETMKSWGLEAFMVRAWVAIERVLWLVALAYALATLVLYDESCGRMRRQLERVLKVGGVVGRRLTVGKVAEGLGLDYRQHRRAWLRCWVG